VKWQVILSRQATKDAKKLAQAGYKPKVEQLLYMTPPPYEKLLGNLSDFYSRRINIQHRLVYSVLDEEKTVHVLRMWTHYE